MRKFFISSILLIVLAICIYINYKDINHRNQIVELNSEIFPENFIINQIHSSGLVHSIENENHFALYDQALAIIVLTHSNKQYLAKRILTTLESIQEKDGSFCFSYQINKNILCKNNQIINGAIAWVSISISNYYEKFKDPQFNNLNNKILQYLSTQEVFIENNLIGIKFSKQDNPQTTWNEENILSTEHNIDYYSALFKNNNKKYKKVKMLLQNKLWKKDHFYSGINHVTNSLDSDKYLDTQAWGYLALGNLTIQGIFYNCENFLLKNKEVGFNFIPSDSFIWYEGTFSQLLAMKRSNIDCETDLIIENINKIYNYEKNAIFYSSSDENKDFPKKLSVASSAWLYFYKNNFNPFQ